MPKIPPKTKDQSQHHLDVGEEDIVAQRYEERVPISTLIPHPMNPNEGDVPFIEKSIRENGWFGAVLVQESTKHIIAGHHSILAALEAGRTTVPVFWKDCNDAEALRILLVDNESARRSRNNVDKLDVALHSLAAIDDGEGLAGSGFTLKDLENLEDNAAIEAGEHDHFVDQYGIILECESEADQQRKFEQLTDLGYENIRVIAV